MSISLLSTISQHDNTEADTDVPSAPNGLLILAQSLAETCEQYELPLPLILAQTHLSLHQSDLSPDDWGCIREGLGADARILLTDDGDLSAYPECMRRWGTEHFAIGGQLLSPEEENDRCVLMVPTALAYVHLCRLFSQVHAQPLFLEDWSTGKISPPDCSDLIVLVQDMHWLRLYREAGAEVYWRCDTETLLDALPDGVPCVAAFLCTAGYTQQAQSLTPVLQALRCNGRVSRVDSDGGPGAADKGPAQMDMQTQSLSRPTLEDLLSMPERYQHHRILIERGRELRDRCRYHPATDIHGALNIKQTDISIFSVFTA